MKAKFQMAEIVKHALCYYPSPRQQSGMELRQVGFNWLLPQSFGLPCFYQNNVLKIYWNACKYVLSKQLKLWNVYLKLPLY